MKNQEHRDPLALAPHFRDALKQNPEMLTAEQKEADARMIRAQLEDARRCARVRREDLRVLRRKLLASEIKLSECLSHIHNLRSALRACIV